MSNELELCNILRVQGEKDAHLQIRIGRALREHKEVVCSYSMPKNGDVKIMPSGNFVYTPKDGFWGQDTFHYFTRDAEGVLASREVEVDIGPYEDGDRAVTVEAGSEAAIDVLGHEHSRVSGKLQIIAMSCPRRGVAVPVGGTRIYYRPDKGFVGDDNLSYVVMDGQGTTSSVFVKITVTSQRCRLDEWLDHSKFIVRTTIGATTRFSPFYEDAPPELRVQKATGARNGDVTICADGRSLAYKPTCNRVGQDEFAAEVVLPGGEVVPLTITVWIGTTE